MNLSNYHLHSGGAKGADVAWDTIGREYGLPAENIKHWRPYHYDQLSDTDKERVDEIVKKTAEGLGRPDSFTGVKLVKRNWFQVENADAVFAIGKIVPPGFTDSRGFVNQTDHEVVEGGTGWAVEMAIQMGKPVFVFDMRNEGLFANKWWIWVPDQKKFIVIMNGIPPLTKNFAGIGSRKLTPEGLQAIRDVYELTKNRT